VSALGRWHSLIRCHYKKPKKCVENSAQPTRFFANTRWDDRVWAVWHPCLFYIEKITTIPRYYASAPYVSNEVPHIATRHKKIWTGFLSTRTIRCPVFRAKKHCYRSSTKSIRKEKILGRYVPVYGRVTSRRQKFLNTEAALADFFLTALVISNMPLYNA